MREARIVSAEFERWIRRTEGTSVEPIEIAAPVRRDGNPSAGKTFEQVFTLFINDPAKARTLKTIARYHEMVAVLYDIWGKQTPIEKIDREACRRLLDTLRWLPTNSPKRYPKMTALEAAEMAKSKGATDTLGPVSVNGYMIVASTILSYAVNEGLADRNHTRGLRVNDPVKKKDKRFPYTAQHLRTIFNSPIYAKNGLDQRKTAKWMVPLIALFTGMRLNEICSLDTRDVVEIEGVLCFSINDRADKSLKTVASERIVPIHQTLLDIGIADVVRLRNESGSRKLFPELGRSKNGHYSVGFSKWYGLYTRKLWKLDEASHKFVFHSFRHNFRDAAREAKIDSEETLPLGGWTSSTNKGEVHQNYGRGFSVQTLKKAIDKLRYPDLDLSHLNIRRLSE